MTPFWLWLGGLDERFQVVLALCTIVGLSSVVGTTVKALAGSARQQRLEAQFGERAAALEGELRQLRGELQGLRGELGPLRELDERVEFAERLLAGRNPAGLPDGTEAR